MAKAKNWDRVNEAFDLLLPVLVKFEVHELAVVFGPGRWWDEGVVPKLSEQQRAQASRAATDEQRIRQIDLAMALGLIDWRWNDVFRAKLPRDARSWAHELRGARNDEAHRGVGDISASRAGRILDTAQLLCETIDQAAAQKIGAILADVRYGGAEAGADEEAAGAGAGAGKKARRGATAALSVGDLPSWRTVVAPHEDVAQGTLRKAEFACDLNQVAHGTASAEYQDARRFFARTYMTAGMEGLLGQALDRVTGAGGEPVIQLKTAFGGGKTHSMLALYHLLTAGDELADAEAVQRLLAAHGLERVPRVNVAVVVGVALNPASFRRPTDLPGITVSTLWGEIAYQLARNAGRPELYRLVKSADSKHVAPGSDALRELFDACGPCLVLIDELVAYAKTLYGRDDLPAGTFDNLVTFVQQLTEAARASKASLVVASIPESEREIGGDAGQLALQAIEHTFGRMESIWQPVTADEGFAVVSRRLFSARVDEAARERVCQAYFQLYQDNPADYPVETREGRYLERLRACYPIHPEVYDRLYEDWATIEGFQRTRGVLRFMAQVIHELWVEGDSMPMIMVGSLPFDQEKVRDELTRYLGDAWNTVVEAEVDGRNSEPVQRDAANTRYGQSFAARRVARAVFLGSAPDKSSQTARGIDIQQVNLAVVAPHENPALFLDALSTLRRYCSYLYADGANQRFWYDTQPNLRRSAESRAQGLPDAAADALVEGLVRRWRAPAPLAGLHACPGSSLDVVDEPGARLVVLGLSDAHERGNDESPALARAREILANRGGGPRRFANAVVFLAADATKLGALRREAKLLLAWRSIQADTDALDLTQSAEREVAASIQAGERTVAGLVDEAYRWALYPAQDVSYGPAPVTWEAVQTGAGGSAPERCVAKLRAEGALVDAWAPMLLKLELDRWLWTEGDCIQVQELWEQLCRWCYLTRLASYEVLEAAICEGLRSSEYFGLAAGVEGSGGERRFVDLHLGDGAAFVHPSSYLVKVDAARAQIEAEAARGAGAGAGAGGVATGGGAGWPDAGSGSGTGWPGGAAGHGWAAGSGGLGRGGDSQEDFEPAEPATPRPHRFTLEFDLDTLGAYSQMQQLINEVVAPLEAVDGVDLSVTVEVRASSGEGFGRGTVRTVSENCSTLGYDGRFESNY